MIAAPIRPSDCWGSGQYGAARGARTHRGVDYACYPGSILLSDFDCTVERVGTVYANSDYKLLQLRIDAQTVAKIMYIEPCVRAGDAIKRGDKIGIVQDISKRYPGITNHYHFEIILEGEHVNPQDWLRGHHGIY